MNSEILDTTKEHLVGKFVYAQHCGTITEIKKPDDASVTVISSEDLLVPRIKILNDFLPVLAQHTVEYPGQPVLAVFGKDIETVLLYISKIQIVIEENNEYAPVLTGTPFKFTSGKINNYFTEDSKTIASEFTVKSHSETLLGAQKFFAAVEDGKIYIKAPSQWPLHVRDTVAGVMKKSHRDVYINPQPFNAGFDQLLIQPSLASAVAAVAAQKTGSMVELQMSLTSWQPETKYCFKTQLDDNGKPVAYAVDVEIDFGAYLFFTEEACYHIMAGLVPSYKVNAFQITIKTFRSNRIPSCFFTDLGYGMALAANEHHFTYITHKLKTSPSDWKTDLLKEPFNVKDSIKTFPNPEALQLLVRECVDDSLFDRKHAVYSQMGIKNRMGRSIMSYSRGIGLTCGQGIHGFSFHFPYISQYGVTLTLSETGRMSVSIGFALNRNTKKNFRDIIRQYFDLAPEDIQFTDINEDTVKDAGPDVLFRSLGMLPMLVENACIALKRKIENGQHLPLTEECFRTGLEDMKFFASCCCGAMAIDMHIDTVRLIPIIDHITVRLKLGKVANTVVLADSVRHTISTTIAEICPCAENIANIDLKIRSNPKGYPGSSASLIRGITTSALLSAMSQAMTHHIEKMPIDENDIMDILVTRREENET